MFLVSKNNPFIVVILFKTVLPMLVGNFYVFACYKWAAIKLGLANMERDDEPATIVR